MELQDGMPNSEENPKNLEDVQLQAEKNEDITDNTETSLESDQEEEGQLQELEPEGAETDASSSDEVSQPVTDSLAPDSDGEPAPEEKQTKPQSELPANDSEGTIETKEDSSEEQAELPVPATEKQLVENKEVREDDTSTDAQELSESNEKVVSDDAAIETQEPSKSDEKEVSDDTTTEAQNLSKGNEEVVANEQRAEEEELEEIDFSAKSKEELLEFAIDLNNQDQIRRLDKYLKPLKSRFDKLFIEERQAALDAFVADGNERDDFEFRGDEQTKKFQDYYDLLREKRNKHYAEFEKRKEDNLKHKEEILVKIRELIDAEETDISIKTVRELQNEWKNVGPVPGQHNKTLWANYNALLDRFYDARSIYFELKDLDRKKNLQLKLDLCVKAEELDVIESVKDAVVHLNELHEEFKHVGPIPRDQQEEIWQRFKAASDKIYVKRKGYVDDLKKAFVENLDKKMQLVEDVEQFLKFDSDRISAWNKKTKEIQELQKKWESVGGIPREKAKDVNKRFWAGFKGFFANKSVFFKKFEAQRGDNLKIKQDLVEEAKALQESSDWVATTDKYKRLQARWKEVGPVPEKFRTSIYEEFKAACDHFFDQRRAQNQEQNQEQEANLKVKMQVCDSLEAIAAEKQIDLDVVYGLLDQFHEAGFVPRHSMKKIQNRFTDVTQKLLKIEALHQDDRQDLKINIEVGKIKGGPHADRKIFRKENSLKRKIENLHSDISTWKNNLEFFASSKAADQLKQDFEAKIVKASEELDELKKELRMLHNS